MEDNLDEATPRALINMVLHHNDPTRTVRPATRRKRKSVQKELQEFTPRTIIGELLRKNRVEKTVRVSLRNMHPKIVQKERNIAKDHDSVGIASEVGNAQTIENQSESIAYNAAVEPVMEETVTEEVDANNNKPSEIVSLNNDTEERTRTSHFEDAPLSLRNLKKRNKRIRLSTIPLHPVVESSDLDTFTEDLLSKVQTLVQKKLNRSVNDTLGTSRIDAYTSPIIFERNDKESQVDNTEIPPSEDDVSSELGPLSLSRLSEGDPNTSSVQNTTDKSFKQMSKQHSSGAKISSLYKETDIVTVPHDDIDAFQDIPMLTTSTPRVGKKPDDIATTCISSRASPELRRHSIATPTSPITRNRGRMSLAQKILSSAKASKIRRRPVKRKPLKRKKHVPNGLPISTSQLKGILSYYSSKKYSKAAVDQIERASKLYFEQTIEFFDASEEKRSKTIKVDDVVSMMKRRRHITRKNPLNLLIEEHFPLEYREELLPVATSGNSIFLK